MEKHAHHHEEEAEPEHWHSHGFGHHAHFHEALHGHIVGHEAGHAHGSEEAERELRFALSITGLIFIAEVGGGLLSNSLALLSDAAHVLSDFLALLMSFLALRLAARHASISRTFGLHRTEIFAALINGLGLVAISAWIFYEAYGRIQSPEAVRTVPMMGIAVVGLLANLLVVHKLRGFAENLNVRSAFMHAVGDAASSIGVILGGAAIFITGQFIIDAVIGLLIGVVILIGALQLLRESTHILMEGTPTHLHLDDVKKTITEVPGVLGVRDLHIWSICSDIHAASAHIVVGDLKLSDVERVCRRIEEALVRFHIEHTTFQFVTGN